MAFLADRVTDSTTTTGTGALTLANSAPTGFQTFAAGFGSASLPVHYVIEGGAEWEVGVGTFNGTTGLTRDIVLASSNSGALVNLSSGTKNVFSDQPAEYLRRISVGNTIGRMRSWHL